MEEILVEPYWLREVSMKSGLEGRNNEKREYLAKLHHRASQ